MENIITTTPARVGNGSVIHAIDTRWVLEGRTLVACGAVFSGINNHAGTRVTSSSQNEEKEVTCKRCVKALKAMSDSGRASCGVVKA